MTSTRLNFRLENGCHRLPRARGDVSHPAQRSADAALHAGRHAGDGEGAAHADARGCGLADPAREYLSPAAAAGARSFPAHRRHPRVHELETLGADRLRRVSDFLAAAFARDERGGRGFPELSRREDDPAQPGGQHRDAEGDRQRHHDGARSVHRLDRG